MIVVKHIAFYRYMMLNVISASCVMLLTSCTLIRDPKDLIKQPALSLEQEKLHQVILNEIPEGHFIVNPADSTHKKAIRTGDLDQDGQKEAVVFYEMPTSSVPIHGMLLGKTKKGSWIKKLDFEGKGTKLHSFKIHTMKNDGRKQIVAGFFNPQSDSGSTKLQSDKLLYVYEYSNGKLNIVPWLNPVTKVKTEALSYSNYIIENIDGKPLQLYGNDVNIIATISVNQKSFPKLTLYEYKQDCFQVTNEIPLDLASNTATIFACKICPDRYGIVFQNLFSSIKAVHLENDVLRISQLLCCSPNERLISKDVNGDGIMEFGVSKIPDEWKGVNVQDAPLLYTFYQFDNKFLKHFVMKQYYDDHDLFSVALDAKTDKNVIIDPRKSIKNKYIRFYKSNSNETVGEIYYFTPDEWKRNKQTYDYCFHIAGKTICFRGRLKPSINKTTLIPTQLLERKEDKIE